MIIALLGHLVILLLAEWSLAQSNFCTITKSNIGKKIVITMTPPTGSIRKVGYKSTGKLQNTNFIQDIVVCPSVLHGYAVDSQFLDDDHYCSRLCDRGFRMHVICDSTNVDAISASIGHDKGNIKPSSRIGSNYNRQKGEDGRESEEDNKMRFLKRVITHLNLRLSRTAIVAQEVSVPPLLRHLADIVSVAPRFSGESTERTQLDPNSAWPAAVVLIDPPPMIPLYTDADRTRLLKDRFSNQMNSLLNSQPEANRVMFASTSSKSYDSFDNDPFEQMDNEYNSKLTFASAADEFSFKVLGGAPSHSPRVGEALRDRILVLSSIPDIPLATPICSVNDGHSDQDSFSALTEDSLFGGTFVPSDTWGLSAAREVSQQYSAGPVIKIGLLREPDSDDDDDNDQDEEERKVFSINFESKPMSTFADNCNDENELEFIGTFARKYIPSADSTDMKLSEPLEAAGDTGWSEDDVKRHTDAARVITDWFDMLSYMKYI